MRGLSFIVVAILGVGVLGDDLQNLSYNSVDNRVVEEDALLNVPELIEKYGYPVEIHKVHTEDGYILEMHRIPYGVKANAGPAPNKPVAFVQHGLLSSSADWIIAGPEKGIGYLLADLGYDVWMGNARGNTYSKKHVSLDPKKAKFWDFSWHEIGIYDLPAMIDYVTNLTGQPKIFYIGHSQGTTSFYVMCSMRPEYNSKIRAMFSLAPIAYMYHMTSPLMKIMATFEGTLEILLKLIGVNEFLPSSDFLAQAGGVLCSESSLTQFICTNSLFVLCGFSVKQMNTELLPVIMGHTPAGSSTKQFLHYAQNIRHRNKFRQWDYGAIKNKIEYGSVFPPSYDIGKITAPVALFYSHNDWLAAEVDVLRLYDELPNTIGRFLASDKYFNHLDYLWGNEVDILVYDKVFSLMTRY